MKHYFLIAKDVGDLTAIVCAALWKSARPSRPKRSTAFWDDCAGARGPWPTPADFRIDTDRVNVIKPDAFERDPVNLIRLYWVADRSSLAIHPDASRLVTQSLKRIDARLRNNPEANRLFLEILTSRRSPETALRRMNEAGRARPLHPRVRPNGRHDAILHVSSLHRGRASAAHCRRAQPDRGRHAAEKSIRWSATSCRRSPTVHRSTSPPFSTTSPRAGRKITRLRAPRSRRRLCPRLGLSASDTDGWPG